MPHRIAVLAFDGISPFHLSVPSIVFGHVPPIGSSARYEISVFAEAPGMLETSAGYEIVVHNGLKITETAETIIAPSWDPDRAVSADLVAAIRRAHDRGARIVGLCLGAYVIAAAGIVDGREVATHWHAAAELAKRHPSVVVRSDVLFSDLGDVISSAGTAAALDCCLHVVRSDLGAAVATDVARRIVLAPHRSGSQAQFIPTPLATVPDRDELGNAMDWARGRLENPIELDAFAAAANMSRRNFSRRFRQRTGMSPGAWLLAIRIDMARMLLEDSDSSIEDVAHASGFGSASTLRAHFTRTLGVSPQAHRMSFRARARTREVA